MYHCEQRMWCSLVHGRNIIRRIDGEFSARNGHRQQKSVRLKGGFQFGTHGNEVLLSKSNKAALKFVGSIPLAGKKTTATYLVSGRTATIGRVFPIKVEAVEAVTQQHFDYRFREDLPAAGVAHHLLPFQWTGQLQTNNHSTSFNWFNLIHC